MKMRFVLPAIGFAACCLAGCVAPPSEQEIALVHAASKPSSQEAAEAAVKQYFNHVLIDAESARYNFPLPLAQGALTLSGVRQFGWFICGDVNAKNRMGAYTGYKPFLAYFSPSAPDTVQDGVISSSDRYAIVFDWCKGLYGVK